MTSSSKFEAKFKDKSPELLQINVFNSKFFERSKLLEEILFSEQFNFVILVKASRPVKSVMFFFLQSISPVKFIASETCISLSPLVLIAAFPTR